MLTMHKGSFREKWSVKRKESSRRTSSSNFYISRCLLSSQYSMVCRVRADRKVQSGKAGRQ
jgi:hypothetical protein